MGARWDLIPQPRSWHGPHALKETAMIILFGSGDETHPRLRAALYNSPTGLLGRFIDKYLTRRIRTKFQNPHSPSDFVAPWPAKDRQTLKGRLQHGEWVLKYRCGPLSPIHVHLRVKEDNAAPSSDSEKLPYHWSHWMKQSSSLQF